eukprot:6622539-Prymnesium_polylepis.1
MAAFLHARCLRHRTLARAGIVSPARCRALPCAHRPRSRRAATASCRGGAGRERLYLTTCNTRCEGCKAPVRHLQR